MPVKVTGVSFDGAHSYNDWGLKLKSVSIGVPKAKTVYVSDEVRDILFSEENECQKVCDRLNAGLGNFLYKNNGESVKEYIKIEKEDKRGKKVR